MREWFEAQQWKDIFEEESVDEKAFLLISRINEAVKKYLPEKAIKIACDDEPWFSQPLKVLDRRRRREYKNRRSPKYLELDHCYKEKISKCKKKYKRDIINDLK